MARGAFEIMTSHALCAPVAQIFIEAVMDVLDGVEG
jgi:hypothetical protein